MPNGRKLQREDVQTGLDENKVYLIQNETDKSFVTPWFQRRAICECNRITKGLIEGQSGEQQLKSENVKVYANDMDSFRIIVNATVSHIFFSWVFGFSGKVEIKAPLHVRNKYIKMIKEAYVELMKLTLEQKNAHGRRPVLHWMMTISTFVMPLPETSKQTKRGRPSKNKDYIVTFDLKNM